MPTTFLYFDLGNVLLTFSNERACRQMAEAAGVEFDRVARLVLGPHEQESLLWRFEHGLVSEDEFYGRFCDELGVVVDRAQLDHAAADMFAPIVASFQLIERLQASGYRLGILSNTNPVHWRFVTDGRWPLLNTAFTQYVTSFEARSMKPDRRIYEYAVAKAGIPAGEVFFVDDRIENVEGAIAAGLDAVQYIDPPTLARDLRLRGIDAG
jgi:glucose-1-phosphatase